MSTATKSIASVLNSLIESCKDGQEGFRSAFQDVKNVDLKSLFSELSMQRQQFASELQNLVSDLGEEMETEGSFGAAFRRGWMDLKAALTNGDEHGVLVECERGEDAAVAEYRDALDHDELPANIRNVVEQQYLVVQASHDRVRDLRDRFQKK
jgi:uncharacterized protein (TIGR02284 family)